MDLTLIQYLFPIWGGFLAILAIYIICRDRDERTKQIKPFLIKFMIVAVLFSCSTGIGSRFEKAEDGPILKVTGLYTAFGSRLAPSLAFFTTVVLNFYAIFSVAECSFIHCFQPFSDKNKKLHLFRIIQTDFVALSSFGLAIALLSLHTTTDLKEINPFVSIKPAETDEMLLAFPYSNGTRSIGLIVLYGLSTLLHFVNIIMTILAILRQKKSGCGKEKMRECLLIHMALIGMSAIGHGASLTFGLALNSSLPVEYVDTLTAVFVVLSSAFCFFCSLFVLFYIKQYRQILKILLCGSKKGGIVSPHSEPRHPISMVE